MYLGEEGSPDGLDIGDLGGTDEGLELVGLCGIESAKGGSHVRNVGDAQVVVNGKTRTVISIPSSARMRAA